MLDFPLLTIAVVAVKYGTAFTSTATNIVVVPTITNGFTILRIRPDELVGSDKHVFLRRFQYGFVSHRFTLLLVRALL